MTRTFSSASTPSISLSSCGTMVFSTSEETPEPRVRNSESISSKNTMTGVPVAGLLTGPLEDQPDVPLGLADVLVEQLGALDVEEVGLPLLAGLGRDLLGQRVGDRLGDQRLAAAGRAVEQHALGRLELVLLEQLGVQVGQLDRVADLLDLADQAADRRVVDVGDLLEDQLLDLGLGHPLVDVAGAGVEQQRVAGAQRVVAQRRGEADDALLVGVGDDQGALAVGEHLLEHHDLADLLEVEGGDDVERLVEHDLLATPQRRRGRPPG